MALGCKMYFLASQSPCMFRNPVIKQSGPVVNLKSQKHLSITGFFGLFLFGLMRPFVKISLRLSIFWHLLPALQTGPDTKIGDRHDAESYYLKTL